MEISDSLETCVTETFKLFYSASLNVLLSRGTYLSFILSFFFFLSNRAVRQTSRTGTGIFSWGHAGELYESLIFHVMRRRPDGVKYAFMWEERRWRWLRRQWNKEKERNAFLFFTFESHRRCPHCSPHTALLFRLRFSPADELWPLICQWESAALQSNTVL